MNSLCFSILKKLHDYKGVIFDEKNIQITGEDFVKYIKLYSASLKKNGISKTSSIGVIADNSFESIVSFFSAWCCCRRVVCINPSYSDDGIANILNDLGADFFISAVQRNIDKKHIITFDLSTDYQDVNDIEPGSGELYILTSGTTSVAKIVPFHEHGFYGFCNLYKEIFAKKPIGKMLLFCPLYFSLGIATLLMSLSLQIPVYIASDIEKRNPKELFNGMQRADVDFCVFPTSYMKLLDSIEGMIVEFPTTVKIITIVGERAFLTKKTTDFLCDNHICLYNQYGMTEVLCLFSYEVNKNDCLEEKNNLPIGKPLNHVRFKIGNGKQTKGVLYISFDVDTPTGPKGSWFCTNDVCEFRNGAYYIVARDSNCVKINGNRIELEFIEDSLLKVPEIQDACVLYLEDEFVSSLVAFIVEKKPISNMSLYQKLETHLPEYMLPRKFIRGHTILRNGNGKIDRNKMRQKYYE